MNERIKELAEQAMEPNGIEGLGGSYMELNPEKFAELIVRECALVGERFANGYDVYYPVLAHFGLEDCDE